MRKPPALEKSGFLGPVAPPPLPVRAPTFDGSLGLLLRLVASGRITLLDIPLAPIASEYLLYVGQTGSQDLDSAGAALLGIAYLIERKASLILSGEESVVEEPELFEPADFAFGGVVDNLEQRMADRQTLFFRQVNASREPYQLPIEYGELSADNLAKALKRLLDAAAPVERDQQQSRPNFSLREKMDEILAVIGVATEPASLETFLGVSFTRLDVVWVFLAMLELVKLLLVEVSIVDDRLFLSCQHAVVRMEVTD